MNIEKRASPVGAFSLGEHVPPHFSGKTIIEGLNVKELIRLLNCENGASSVEYALIAIAIAGVIVATVGVLGDKVHLLFNSANEAY